MKVKCPICDSVTNKRHCQSRKCTWFMCSRCAPAKAKAVVFNPGTKNAFFEWREIA
jgi:hypothetical protein